MASKEIELSHFLKGTGLDLVETDLGEFIIQISHDKPSHLVAPIMHKDRASIARLFSEYFKTPYNEDPPTLTAQARAFLRDKFRHADLGITGGNFLVAETGQVCVVENEGNVRQSLTTPRILISLVGIERLVPRLADLAVMLKLLARSATGQPMTVYTNLFGGPRICRREGRARGIPSGAARQRPDRNPRRSRISPNASLHPLRRLSECLPRLSQDRRARLRPRLPRPHRRTDHAAVSGAWQIQGFAPGQQPVRACYEACPVKIDIPRLLINLRRDIHTQRLSGEFERLIYKIWRGR